MATTTKKQHYVPQLLLKHFAKRDRICIFDSTRNLFRENSLTKNEFARNYFYDDTGKVDPLLSTGVEAPATLFIDELAKGNINSDSNPPKEILRFAVTQLMRTPSALTQALEAIDVFSSSLIKQIGELNGFPEEITKKIKLRPKDPRTILNYITAVSVVKWPLIKDLGQRLLINETDTPFIISDHPVIQYNWYLRKCPDPAKTSLPARGLMIFLPISPKATLCLYDRTVYKFKNKNSPISPLSTHEDINLLNSLQAMSREDSIIFSDKKYENYVRTLCEKFKPNSIHTSHSTHTHPNPIGNNKLTTTHAVWRSQANIEKWISIVSIRRRAKSSQDKYSHRLPDAVAQHERIMALFKEDWEKMSSIER